MLIPYSKFLRSLLRDRISRAGVQDVSIVLTEVRAATVKSLVEYIYTGKTKISRIKEVNEIDTLRRLLQIKIDIDKKIYPLDKSRNTSKSKSEEKLNHQAERSSSEPKSKEMVPLEKVKLSSGKKLDQSQEKSKLCHVSEPEQSPQQSAKVEEIVKEAENKVIKRERDSKTSDGEKDPYNLQLVEPLKLRVKVETNSEPEPSIFERILKSISGEKSSDMSGQEPGQAEEESDSSDSESSSGEESDEDSEGQDDSIPQVSITRTQPMTDEIAIVYLFLSCPWSLMMECLA